MWKERLGFSLSICIALGQSEDLQSAENVVLLKLFQSWMDMFDIGRFLCCTVGLGYAFDICDLALELKLSLIN